MKSMDERRAAIKKQLRGGKRNTLRELSEAIGEELERTRAAVKKMCALGELIQEGDGARGQKAVYLLTRAGEEENDEELDKPDDRRMVDGIWADELERTRNRVQVGEKLKVMLLADTRTKGEVRTVRRTVRVISKHRYLVRTSDGSSSTYAELAMYYRGKILDWR